jgi:hypothetical protein
MATFAEVLLSGYPGPVTLYPSRKRQVRLLLLGAVLTAGGVWLALDADPVGWFAAVFFGYCVVTGVINLLPGAASLSLNKDGFQARNFFRRVGSDWQDVTGFKVHSGLPPVWSGYVRYSENKSKGLKAIFGRSHVLPDTYGLPSSGLAQLLTEWRDQAIAAKGK